MFQAKITAVVVSGKHVTVTDSISIKTKEKNIY